MGCENKPGKEVIDTAYLESSEYQSFQKKTSHEREKLLSQKKNFTEFLRTKIKTHTGAKLKLPGLIDEKKIQNSLNNDVDQSLLITLLGFKQIYHPIVKAEAGEMEYYFFATCKVANYKECLIWFASAKGDDLIEVQMICTYKKTLTYGETPVINVTPSTINIEINRYADYPLRTLHNYTLQYNITASGQILRVPVNESGS